MNRKKILPVAVVTTALIAGYVGAVAVAKHKIRDVVDANLAEAELRLEERGHDATFSYTDVSVHGFSLRPSAVVHSLKLQLKPSGDNAGEVVISTPEVHYLPKNFGMTNYELVVPQSIEVSTTRPYHAREQVTVSYDSAPVLEVIGLPGKEHGFELDLPKSITLTKLTETVDAVADESGVLSGIDIETAKADVTEITHGEKPLITWHTDVNRQVIGQKVSLSKVAVAHQYEAYLSIDQVSFDLNQTEKDTDAKTQKLVSLLKVENLNLVGVSVVNPVNIVSDLTYAGPILGKEDQTFAPGSSFAWDVKDISITTGLSSFSAQGQVSVQPDKERLPHGQLVLRFENLRKLFAHLSETRPDAVTGIAKVRAALERLSGANIAAGEVAVVELAREEGGRLQVGKLSLEEAFAVGFDVLIHIPAILSSATLDTPTPPEAAVEGLTGVEPQNAGEPVAVEGELVTPLEVAPAEEAVETTEEVKQDEAVTPQVEVSPAAE